MQNQQDIGGSFNEATEPRYGYTSNYESSSNASLVNPPTATNMQSVRAPGSPQWGLNRVQRPIHYWSAAPINTPSNGLPGQHTVTPGASSSRGRGFSQFLPGEGSRVLGQGYVPRVLPEPPVHFPTALGFAGNTHLLREFIRMERRTRSEIRAVVASHGGGQHNMPLDVDGMTYEQLLDLGEEMGIVKTGLKEEFIVKNLRQGVYLCEIDEGSSEAETCCICQEDYVEGDALGMLDCKHIFHTGCIKRWLVEKNVCPICKKTALLVKRCGLWMESRNCVYSNMIWQMVFNKCLSFEFVVLLPILNELCCCEDEVKQSVKCGDGLENHLTSLPYSLHSSELTPPLETEELSILGFLQTQQLVAFCVDHHFLRIPATSGCQGMLNIT